MGDSNSKEKTQAEKFRHLAKESECDEDEAAFNEKLKHIAKSKSPPEKKSDDDKK